MEPFERHRADLGELRSCGAQLISRADQGLRNGGLTRQAYQPAIANWNGLGAPELAAAAEPIGHECEQASGALAWASVVAHYWADRVEEFNAAVDRIVDDRQTEISQAHLVVLTPEDLTEARAQIDFRARRRWWDAYNLHILDAEDRVAAMLRDGPTREHVAEARRVGLIGGWAPSLGHFTPPSGGGPAFDNGQMALFGIGLLAGGLEQTGLGMASRYNATAGAARTAWLRSSAEVSNWRLIAENSRQRGGGYYDPRSGKWVERYWRARNGMVGVYAAAHSNRLVASSNASASAAVAANAAQQANKWNRLARVAGPVGTIASATSGSWDQWSRDAGRSDIDTGERVARSATRGAAVAGGAWAGALGGAKTGAMIGAVLGPKGAIVGGVIGGLVGGFVGSGVGNMVADGAVELVSAGWDTAKDVGNGLKDAGSSLVNGVKGLFG